MNKKQKVKNIRLLDTYEESKSENKVQAEKQIELEVPERLSKEEIDNLKKAEEEMAGLMKKNEEEMADLKKKNEEKMADLKKKAEEKMADLKKKEEKKIAADLKKKTKEIDAFNNQKKMDTKPKIKNIRSLDTYDEDKSENEVQAEKQIGMDMADLMRKNEEEMADLKKKAVEKKTDLKDIAEERDAFLDQLLRNKAEFMNYQKRMIKETEATAQLAVKDLTLDLVSELDNFDRALKLADDSNDIAKFVEGIKLIEARLIKVLGNYGVEFIDTTGKAFDPNVHEAVMEEENNEMPQHTIISEFQRGFMLKERVVRPAKVKVSKRTIEEGKEGEDVEYNEEVQHMN
ncbi:MAG: nucleotide exchange factor GrpE [Candidatus Brocadiaceae bacterium]|nr:nucleotide exchange factor GrpE [Candidatus Brocadiaceae bacterium]